VLVLLYFGQFRKQNEQGSGSEQGCQIFFVAYGQTPDKKWLFFEKVVAKIAKCFNYCNFHIHRCLKLFGRQYIFCQKNVVLPKKQVFTLKQQFLL